jgi:hypothetical protein
MCRQATISSEVGQVQLALWHLSDLHLPLLANQQPQQLKSDRVSILSEVGRWALKLISTTLTLVSSREPSAYFRITRRSINSLLLTVWQNLTSGRPQIFWNRSWPAVSRQSNRLRLFLGKCSRLKKIFWTRLCLRGRFKVQMWTTSSVMRLRA